MTLRANRKIARRCCEEYPPAVPLIVGVQGASVADWLFHMHAIGSTIIQKGANRMSLITPTGKTNTVFRLKFLGVNE